MKFVDTNVLVYAYFVPKHPLLPHEQELKRKSRNIILRIEAGERIMFSVVTLSELANILRRSISIVELADLLESFYAQENIVIISVSPEIYLLAINLSRKSGINLNDCLTALLMQERGVKQIYTFDEDFKKFPWVEVQNI